MEEPQITMMARAAGFKNLWNAVRREIEERISPEAVRDEELLNVTVVTEWIDPVTGDKRLLDHHLTFGGEHVAPPWTAKGMLIEAFQQYDQNRGRD